MKHVDISDDIFYSMTEVAALLKGYQRFHAQYFLKKQGLFDQLSQQGQKPKTLIIACSDSRVDPSILLDTDPGDLFVIRNVANLVPPYEPTGDSRHGTSAALEFGVEHLAVKHIVILGHSQCGGIRALVDSNHSVNRQQFSFINDWVKIAVSARNAAQAIPNLSIEERCEFCEKEAIKASLINLMTFPWIADKVGKGHLKLHGWYFSLKDGHLSEISEDRQYFQVIPS